MVQAPQHGPVHKVLISVRETRRWKLKIEGGKTSGGSTLWALGAPKNPKMLQ